MKKLIAAVTAICLAAVLLLAASSAGTEIFTAVDNTLLPLKASTMPAYFGGNLFIPYSVFSSNSTGVYSVAVADNSVLNLYTGGRAGKRLEFDVTNASTSDSAGGSYPGIYARAYNGTVYVPAGFVCYFFGLSYSLITVAPAPVYRIKSSDSAVNDQTFISIYQSKLQESFDEYTAAASPPVETASPTPSIQPSSPSAITYESVTLYLCFSKLSETEATPILDLLDDFRIKCCFFVTGDDVLADPGLIRRISGTGHSVGLLLETGARGEYERASSLLFEAAKLRTSLAAIALPDGMEQADLSGGLIYQDFQFIYSSGELPDNIIAGLPVKPGARQALMLPCGNDTVNILQNVLSYIIQNRYSTARLTETATA